jgi:hypothetical protein
LAQRTALYRQSSLTASDRCAGIEEGVEIATKYPHEFRRGFAGAQTPSANHSLNIPRRAAKIFGGLLLR